MGVKMGISSIFSKWLGRSTPADSGPVGVAELDPADRLSLTFRCAVQRGEGRFSAMLFPGRDQLLDQLGDDAADWPETPCPGSLNCSIVTFPQNLDALAGPGDRIQKLDSGLFAPEFSIPRKSILNNRVGPSGPGENPRMGIAQAWHCAVRNEETGEAFHAWHVRRIDGTYPKFHNIIELMADRRLRTSHGLNDNTPLTITMYSKKQL